MKKSDYEQWKEWFDKWEIDYEESTYHSNIKELIMNGRYANASVIFDLKDNFILMTAYDAYSDDILKLHAMAQRDKRRKELKDL